MYIESILALQAKAGGNAQLPLAIMTSGDTHERTEKLLQENAYFGMQEAQVTLLKQEKVLSADPTELPSRQLDVLCSIQWCTTLVTFFEGSITGKLPACPSSSSLQACAAALLMHLRGC